MLALVLAGGCDDVESPSDDDGAAASESAGAETGAASPVDFECGEQTCESGSQACWLEYDPMCGEQIEPTYTCVALDSVVVEDCSELEDGGLLCGPICG